MKLIINALRLIWTEIDVLLRTLAKEVGVLLCHFYVLMWSAKTPLVWALTESGRWVLITSFGLLVLEAVATIFSHELRTLHAHLEVPLPLWLKIVILLLSLWMFRYKWREMKSHHRATVFSSSMANLLEQIASHDLVGGTPEQREQNLQYCIESILVAFKQAFGDEVSPKLNLMMPDGEGGRLRILKRFPPDPPYDEQAIFEPGQGGAGKAYRETCAVYIPAIRFSHGIILFTIQEDASSQGGYTTKNEMRIASRIYHKTAVQPYKSILSVPVRTVRHPAKAIGVLNVDANKQNAFNRFDFDLAYVAANTIAMVLDIKNSVPYNPDGQSARPNGGGADPDRGNAEVLNAEYVRTD